MRCAGAGDAYALQLPEASDQLADFERLAHPPGPESRRPCRCDWLRSSSYTGDLLPEVGPAEWAVEERARLRLLAASVGSKRPGTRWPPGDCATRSMLARRSVSLDRYHDSSWQLVVAI